MRMDTVAVYGTLRRGKRPVALRGYRLFQPKGMPFPTAIKTNDSSMITVELIPVSDVQLNGLDRYEGVPDLYQRSEVDSSDLLDGCDVVGSLYIYLASRGLMSVSWKPIIGGDWKYPDRGSSADAMTGSQWVEEQQKGVFA